MAIPPKIVKLTIQPGSMPSATINGNDSVFWFNNTTQNHQPVYSPGGGKPAVHWGAPPDPLPPQKSSSQVVFNNPPKKSNLTFNYSCLLHPTEKGTITVKPNN